MRDRSTEMRMLDLQAQQLHEQANRDRDEFFETGGNLPQEEKIKRYNDIMDLYARAKALTDEKVAIAEIMHSLLSKYSQKINKEILHFKLELEADNPGITEQIEKKFNETERNLYLQRKERRRKYREAAAGGAAMINGNSDAPSEAANSANVGEASSGAAAVGGVESTAPIHRSASRMSLAAAAAAAENEASSGSRARSTVSERDPDLPPLKVIVVS
ncbi:unnamed protein product [Gongylonema pulchrum]|uniref:Inhibitor of growth protein N-terminal histone-binding domain-containing protein n=1 Tax=Gongylonema pulchrum TaxID=637853 RepID=A0A3P6PQB0_9BILA|nr:unnamed protein product [Gongylonema pulchrum]